MIKFVKCINPEVHNLILNQIYEVVAEIEDWGILYYRIKNIGDWRRSRFVDVDSSTCSPGVVAFPDITLQRVVKEKPTVCPCGIYRGNCTYHKD